MIKFIVGMVIGGIIGLFIMILLTAGKKADSIQYEYYQSRYFVMKDSIDSIIDEYYNDSISAEDALMEIKNKLEL